jgi:hypothetical protein
VPSIDVIGALIAQTGGLEPSASATHADLADLRRVLVSSINSGQSISDIGPALETGPGSPELLKELGDLAAHAGPIASIPIVPGTTVRVARRSTPVSIPSVSISGFAEADWTAGLKPSQTFGPFLDKTGRPWWFDVFTFSSPLEVRRGAAVTAFLTLPQGVTVSGILPRYNIPAGSVWIASSQFTSAAPPNTFVGIRIKSGQLNAGALAALADPLVIPADATVTLTIVPDPASQPGPASGPGLDATNAQAAFPASVSFVFAPSGITSIDAEPAVLTAYGTTVHLTKSAADASYDAAIRQILIPFTPDTATFSIASVASTAFLPKGSATVTSAAWAFPPTQASAVFAGATAATGTLALVVENGLAVTWPGLIQGPVDLNKAYFEFDGDLLFVFAPSASNLRANQTFELWNDAELQTRCRLDAKYTRPFPLSLLSSRRGVDGVSASAKVQALIDQPVTAGGTRLQPELPANILISQNAASGMRLLIASNAQPDTSGKRMALALSNALITTSPIDAFFSTGALTTPTTVDQGTFSLTFRPFQILPSLADPYAANFENLIRDSPVPGLQLRVTVTWPDPATPALDFALLPNPNSQQLAQLFPVPRNIRRGDGLLELFNHWTGGNAFNQLALSGRLLKCRSIRCCLWSARRRPRCHGPAAEAQQS